MIARFAFRTPTHWKAQVGMDLIDLEGDREILIPQVEELLSRIREEMTRRLSKPLSSPASLLVRIAHGARQQSARQVIAAIDAHATAEGLNVRGMTVDAPTQPRDGIDSHPFIHDPDI